MPRSPRPSRSSADHLIHPVRAPRSTASRGPSSYVVRRGTFAAPSDVGTSVSTGAWIVVVAVVVALAFGLWRAATDGRFRGTHAVRRSAGTRPESVDAATPVGAELVATVGASLGERATLLQFSSAFCAPCRATRRVLDEVTGLVDGRRPRRGRRRAPPRGDARLRHPAHPHDDRARRLGGRGHPGDGRAHPRPGPDARWRRRDLTIWMHGPHRETRRESVEADAYCRRHVLDHAHQAPRSGPLPRALGAVSNVLTGSHRSSGT